jgi:hypothetical protein
VAIVAVGGALIMFMLKAARCRWPPASGGARVDLQMSCRTSASGVHHRSIAGRIDRWPAPMTLSLVLSVVRRDWRDALVAPPRPCIADQPVSGGVADRGRLVGRRRDCHRDRQRRVRSAADHSGVEDCAIWAAARRLWAFLVADTGGGCLRGRHGAAALAAAASLLVAAGLALVAWCPGRLAVIPLQAAAWLIRGLVFQFMAATALVAYERNAGAFSSWPTAAAGAPDGR